MLVSTSSMLHDFCSSLAHERGADILSPNDMDIVWFDSHLKRFDDGLGMMTSVP